MTVVQRGKKWAVSVKDPSHPKGQRWVGSFLSEEIAREEEAAAKREIRLARDAAAETISNVVPLRAMTVREYSDRFLSFHCNHLEASTLRDYSYEVRRFCREFGDRKLHEIDRREAVDWSHAVPKNTRRVIRAMFAKAAYDGAVVDNHFAKIVVPNKAGGRGGDRLIVITAAQLDTLVQTAEEYTPGQWGKMFGAMLTIAAFTGMRPGELFALKWEDIDAEGFKVNVRHSRRNDGKEKAPKNGRERTVAFPPQAVAALANVTRRGQYVFATKRAKQFSPHTFGDEWRPVRFASGVPIKDVYELRHYCATRLVEAGLQDWQVAHQLGHTDNGKLVRKVYFHPSTEGIHVAILKAWAA